jgi:hypothetical protein
MRVFSILKENPKRVLLAGVCCATLAIMGGTSVSGSAPWVVGDLVVCVGSGQCRVYSTPTTFTTISVPNNPKKGTGEPAWSSAFALYVVDASNQKISLFRKTDPHTLLQTIDTAANYSPGIPGPLVVDSAGNLYVGMTNADVILKYDRNGSFVAPITVASDNGGGVDWMALADDHSTLWYTSGSRSLQRFDLSTNTNGGTVPLLGPGVAGGIRILPVNHSFDPDDNLVVDGTSGILVADDGNIKLVAGGTEPKLYDVSNIANEGWRAVTLHPDGKTFVAATAAGEIYSFLIEGTGEPIDDPIQSGSSAISGLSFKGGNQPNIRSMNFTGSGTSALRVAVFGNPAAGPTEAFPRHAFGASIQSLPVGSNFSIVVSANWVVGDGECLPLATPENDYDCRAKNLDALARCIPYVSGSNSNCVFYHVEDDAITVPQAVAPGILKLIDFQHLVNSYEPAPCTGHETKGNPRMLFEGEPTGGSFEFDITTGATQTAGDPIFGGGRGGSDYAAFDRCLDAGGAELVISKPVENGIFQAGRSLPFEAKVLKNGAPVDALAPPYGMSLYVLHHDSGTFYFEPQPTPGSSSPFFKKRGTFGANWDTTGKPLGSYIACITSTSADGVEAGLFATGCVNFSLVAKTK